MIKSLVKIDPRTQGAQESKNKGPITDESPEFDPVKLQSDLIKRKALLDRLISEGHNSKDIKELKTAITAALADLEEILEQTMEDPEMDTLSAGEI